MVSILHTVHYASIEAYLLSALGIEGDLALPTAMEDIYPDLYYGLGPEQMLIELKRITSSLKLLNVLSHYLYFRKDFNSFLDHAIDDTLKLLGERTYPNSLDQREAYDAIAVLKANIRTDIVEDRLRDLQEKEKNAMEFLNHIHNTLGHNILKEQRDPLKHGEIY